MTLTVGIDVSVSPGSGAGGVEQHLLGLVDSLAAVGGDDIEYVLVTDHHDTSWLEPYVGENMRIEALDPPSRTDELLDSGRSLLQKLSRPVLKRQNFHNSFREPTVPDADGRFLSLGVDIVHFPTPDYRRTTLPTIYNPHDLQHRHYPENFSPYTREQRDVLYTAGCREADAVDVPSWFVRDDVVDQFGINEDQIYVVERGPPTGLYDDVSETDVARVRDRYELPDPFVFYPAQPLPHKNHERLVRALDRLVADGLDVHLVCTGHPTGHWKQVVQTAESTGVRDRIHMLGFVPDRDLRALYHCATLVAFPSLFEGGGFPLLEAWREGVPVACSNTTALGEKSGDATVSFDPESVSSIAAALRELWENPERRRELVARGDRRVEQFAWTQTGRRYRALYRSVGGKSLTETDRQLLREMQTPPQRPRPPD